MYLILTTVIYTLNALTCICLIIYLISKKSDFFCKVPGLDIAVSFLTWIPWTYTFFKYGYLGLIGCIIGQILSIYSFSFTHSLFHKYKGPTIRVTLDKIVGPIKNHLGLIISLLAFPVFWIIRLGQIIIYPLLIWTLRFPKYNSSEWINISRQKFKGLVGHDLIWCLYCDWMTGIYSLGGEMLRNVESFWCPIRFDSDKKCENCKIDFPDIENWVPKEGTMEEVTKLLVEKYPLKSKADRSWFKHSGRK